MRLLYSVFAGMEYLKGFTVSISTLAGDRYPSRLAFPLRLLKHFLEQIRTNLVDQHQLLN